MISNCTTRKSRSGRHGFSLVEIAVVLSVFAIITGAVWVFASQAWENTKQRQLKEEINSTVKNTRAYYQSRNGFTGSQGFTRLTPALINVAAIPVDLTRSAGSCTNNPTNCADNPWGGDTTTAAGGSFGVCAWQLGADLTCDLITTQGAGPWQYFAVELHAVPQQSCINAVIANSGADAPSGLYDVFINNNDMLVAGNTLPPLASNISAACNQPLDNTIDFVYRLVIPQL